VHRNSDLSVSDYGVAIGRFVVTLSRCLACGFRELGIQGRGLADRLIRFALEDARARGLAVLPFCPFVKAFIERHREFEALVPNTYREQFGL
jgi:hypothetical protein